VNTNAARYQNLSINQSKLSGQCGRLKCCLNYELDTYMDALRFFPDDADNIEVATSRAYLVKKDIFRNLMWYSMPDSNKQYPLTIDRVKKIKELNRQGIKPESLEPVEVISSKSKEIEPEYTDVVGQISLKNLEKTSRKRREQEKKQTQPRGNKPDRGSQGQQPKTGGQQGRPAGNRPQQPGGNQQNRNRNNPNRQQGPNRNPNQPQKDQNPGNKPGDKNNEALK